MSQAYKELEKIFAEISNIDGAMNLLHWDMVTMMPKGGEEIRTEQVACLTSIRHEKIKNPKIPDLLLRAKENAKDLTNWQQANIRQMVHLWDHEAALEDKLVAEFSKAKAVAELKWQKITADGNFADFAPDMQNLIDHTKEMALQKSEILDLDPYDAMIDSFDQGRSVKQIDPVFKELKEFLPEFLNEVLEFQATNHIVQTLPKGKYNVTKQKKLGLELMQLLEFDFDSGRLDESHHPFCGGVPGDVRLTTRYREDEFLTSLMGIFHETGHANYENNLPKEWRMQPVGKALGMSIHESQSLFIEMQCFRNKNFMRFIKDKLVAAYDLDRSQWDNISLENVVKKVERSYIRVDADEVTYPLHVILRYEIEKEIFQNGLMAKEIPDMWNELMQKYIGIKPTNVKNGCLQDVHWPSGAFGYFPAYTLGAITAAGLFKAMKTEMPDIENDLAKGSFTKINNWLHTNIHNQGSLYPASDLIEKITGNVLDVENYKNHLKNRYLTK